MVSNHDIILAFHKILEKLGTLEVKINLLPEVMGRELLSGIKDLTFRATSIVPTFLTLNVAEERTLEILKSLNCPATADEISSLSHRARAVESMYLNGLHRRDMVLKERRGRKAFFILKGEYRDQGQTVGS
jgi:hypothetical protein